ncbi:hypothetical protein B0T10DRAFT_591724 [Thelonectria olida]|uniref:Glycosyl transferase CAP10 domain-containing protein n=1 Tax=Thelonectria olida TaxID=1576542 RepID=A0A9P9ARH3_9HYPO|nr:hypothetical protein B0T10DRAFT_591724 [Thelonectria olida]
MFRPRLDNIDSISMLAAAALLFTVVTEFSSRREDELYSELLCWVLLPLLLRNHIPSETDLSGSKTAFSINPKAQYASSPSLWIVAGSLATLCFFRAEKTKHWQPALTPVFLITRKSLESTTHSSKETSNPSSLLLTPWGSALVAAFSVLTLSERNLRGAAFSLVATAASFIIYASFLPRNGKKLPLPVIPCFGSCVVSLSYRFIVISLLGLFVRAFFFDFPTPNPIHILFLSLTKALSWYYVSRTVHQASWAIAPVRAVYGILSTCNPFNLSSDAQALSHVIGSLLSLGQFIELIPKWATARLALWAFVLVPLVPYLINIWTIQMAIWNAPSFGQQRQHPVDALCMQAKRDFGNLVQSQSTNLTAAHTEYQRRYGIEPPPGFEAWYDFASSHESPIIDNFDLIDDAISPLRALSGNQVLDMMAKVQKAPNVDLWLCHFSSKNRKTECTHPYRAFDRHVSLLFDTILGNITGFIPDVKFLVNHIDEPRVLLPPGVNTKLHLEALGHQPTWRKMTKNCSYRKEVASEKDATQTFGLPFVTNLSSTLNLCQHPEYSTMHGLMMSPTTFRLIEGLVPVLSTGAPSTMGDILFPSPAYIESGFQYEETTDVDWEKKRNSLYWAGSTTGGFAQDENWRLFHRQRFVELGQNLGRKQHYYLREKNGIIQKEKSFFLNGRLFDVAFTRIFQCQRAYWSRQDAYFNTKAWADKDKALQSRLVFDIDGNGISGRYYKLLASKSAPLKQTLFREWHDERLVPWMHYIPVSQSMEELPELVFFLTSTDSGRKRAKEIAEEGREWYIKAFREVDLGIYTYRLLLELARLQDPERETHR